MPHCHRGPAPDTNEDDYTDEDMAAVGRGLMEALRINSGHAFLQDWHPADCPSEIVVDLLNALDEARGKAAVMSGDPG